MKTTITACVLGLAMWLGQAAAQAGPRDERSTLRVPQDYPTITAAIAAARAGDRIKVDPGVYREQVVIDKPLTLEGTSPELTIIDGERSTSLPALGQVRVVAAGDVEVSRLKVVNAGLAPEDSYYFQAGDLGAAICVRSPVAGVRYAIHDVHVVGWGDTGGEVNEVGLYAYGGLQDLDFRNSVVEHCNAQSVFGGDHAGTVTIQDNSLAVGVLRLDGIFWAVPSGAGDVGAPLRILGNTIDAGTAQPAWHTRTDRFATAITVGGGPLGGYGDVQIVGNTIRNISPNRRGIQLIGQGAPVRGVIADNWVLGAGGYIGITLWGSCQGVRVVGNLVTGITGEPAPGTNAGIRLRTWFDTSSPVGCRIQGNIIMEALRGISIEATAQGNVCTLNTVRALGPVAVQLGASTSGNAVVRNLLQAALLRGDAAVADAGVDNTVRGNR